MVKNNLVIAHGDLDGIISTVCLMEFYELKIAETEVFFVQPFTVDKAEIPEETEEVFVVDVAVNNRDPQMTIDFIRRIGDRLVKWVDHHQGWTTEITGNNPAFVIIPEAKSCASIIGIDPILMSDAEKADTRTGTLSSRAILIEQAMKANLSDDSIRLVAVKWLLGDKTAGLDLEEAAKKYAEIQAETERLTATYLILFDKQVAIVDARKSNRYYDLTQLLLAGQKLVPFAIVLTVHPQQGEGLTIATSRKDVNLVELFGLGSGAPFRVSLPGKRLDEAIEKLAKIQ